MRENAAQLAVILMWALLCGVCGFAAFRLHELDRSIKFLMQRIEQTMQTITQPVTRADGATVTISTTRLPDESTDQWKARHDAAVAAFKNS